MSRESVRERTTPDLDVCVQVLAEVHERDGYPVDWPSDPAGWLSPQGLLGAWVAELDGRVVGHIGLCRAGSGDAAPAVWSGRTGAGVERTAVVTRLFVGPAGRGRGVGALLIGAAEREACARGLHPVLDVVTSDTAATALYDRLGWEFLAMAEQCWGPDRMVAVRCYAAPALSASAPGRRSASSVRPRPGSGRPWPRAAP